MGARFLGMNLARKTRLPNGGINSTPFASADLQPAFCPRRPLLQERKMPWPRTARAGGDRSGLVHRSARPPGAVGAQLPQVFVASGERPRQCSVERLTVYAASLPCRGHGLNIRRLRPGRTETAELMSLGFHIIRGREMGGVAKTVGEHGPSGVEPVDAGRRIGGEHDTPRCCLEGDA